MSLWVLDLLGVALASVILFFGLAGLAAAVAAFYAAWRGDPDE